MTIIFRLDRVMADRKISLNELAKRIQLTDSNLSIFKTGKAKAVRVQTLDALCRELNCQPADLLEYQPENEDAHE
jgi:putative transcriptional regulator